VKSPEPPGELPAQAKLLERLEPLEPLVPAPVEPAPAASSTLPAAPAPQDSAPEPAAARTELVNGDVLDLAPREDAAPGSRRYESLAEELDLDSNLDSLLRRASAQLLDRWQYLSEQLSEQLSEDPAEDLSQPSGSPELEEESEERRLLAEQLLAMACLRPAPELRTALPGAAAVLSGSDSLESSLLAAAALERAGLPRERDDSLLEICRALDPGSEDDSSAPLPVVSAEDSPEDFPEEIMGDTPGTAAGGFRLRNVVFASRIGGAGDYAALEAGEYNFGPGAQLLVYGEFHGYVEHAREEVDPGLDSGADPAVAYTRRFSASMRLVDSRQQVVDSRCFLKPEDGIARGSRPGELVNFWLRYRLPERLPAGLYKLIIDARDLEGGQTAAALLELRVAAAGGRE
jgi:hypothetical protein